jgi:hypothetical protein
LGSGNTPTFLGATLTGGTATASAPLINATQTWNNAATTFTGILANVTDTASSSSSLLMDLQTGGVSQFRVAKNGRIVAQTLTIGTGGQTNVSTNTAFGFETLNSASLTGGANVGIGYQALRACTSGFWNTAVGHSALLAATSGWANTALGLQAAVNLTSGTANTAIGMNALQSVGTTSCHTAIGRGALSSVGLGSNNTAIGCDCGNTITSGSSNIAIGNNVQVDSGTASNQINIGNHYYHNRAFLYNTFTDASNYERGKLEWASNVLRIGTEKAGTGSARALELQTDGVTRLTIGTTGLFTIADALNIAVGTTTGTKIGTATTQKLAFFNATPVVQPTAVADATDAASVITQLNALLSRMRTLGLIAT